MEVRICGEIKHSSVNGVGIRYVVFFQGCPHNCPGCHNPETHSISGGDVADTKDIIQRISSTKFLDGVTLSGGEPFLQPRVIAEIAKAAHKMGLNVWAYTGWKYEQLLSTKDRDIIDALKCVDVLVDGPFVKELKSTECIWRGSTNQRLINVPKSLTRNKTITIN